MNKFPPILLFFVFVASLSSLAYESGPNLIKNGLLAATKQSWKPDDWTRMAIPKTAKGYITQSDGGWKLYFKAGQVHAHQLRLVQYEVKCTPGKVYQFEYFVRTAPGIEYKRDAFLLGTGVWCRFYKNPPLQEWTKTRGIFYIPTDVPQKGKVIVGLQNRSASPIWYKDISLRETDIDPKRITDYCPEARVQPLTPDDALITPSVKKEHVQFVVNGIPKASYDNFYFDVKLYTSNTGYIQGRVNGKRIEVPVKPIPEGRSILQVLVYDKKDNALVKVTKQEIERIVKMPAGIDFSKVNYVKTPAGDKIFPIGTYVGTTWNFSLKDLKEKGFNTIHTYATDSWRIRDENKKLLNQAKEEGIWIMMGLPIRFQKNAKQIENLTKWINAYKPYNERILFYYGDEVRLAGTPFDVMKKTLDAVHETDPERKLYMFERPEHGLGKVLDGLMVYVSSKSMANIIKLRVGNVPIIHVWGNIDYKNSYASSKEYNQYNFVMPIIWGARGLFYYTLRNLKYKEYNLECEKLAGYLYPMFKMFSKVGPAVVSEEKLPEWTKNISIKGSCEYKFFRKGEVVYLFAGVAASSNKCGSLRLQLPNNVNVEDVLNVKIVDCSGVLKKNFNPGNAAIYKIVPYDNKPKPVND